MGMPAAIMVASCRLNTAMSSLRDLAAAREERLPCVFTRVAATP